MIRRAEEDYLMMVIAEENLDNDELFALGLRKEIARALAEINQLRAEIETLERRNEHQRRIIDDTVSYRKNIEILAREYESRR